MSVWIFVAIAGGMLCLASLVIGVRRYLRGQLERRQMLILLIGGIAVVSIAVAIGLLGKDSDWWFEFAVWIPIAWALIINARHRRRQTRGSRSDNCNQAL